jgi:ATP adenylyltransferase
MKYIVEEANDKTSGCLFCPRIADKNDGENLIVHRAPLTAVFMNKYPYNNGHLLVMPLRHVAELDDLEENELFELFEVVRTARRSLDMVMKPHGYNIGINLGEVAGAGVPGHLHAHIVPRWNGDTNFMPVLSETKVISEGLGQTRDKLAEAFKSLSER